MTHIRPRETTLPPKPRTITAVCGFPRSGTSLTMRMLRDGGMPVYAAHDTSFEHENVQRLPSDWQWILSCRGKAVKILDPQLFTPPAQFTYDFIWLDRNFEEQAKSQLKFLRATTGLSFPGGRDMICELVASMRRDYLRVMKLFESFPNHRLLVLRFEDILSDPKSAGERLEMFCGIDAIRAAACVIPRSPECFDGMLELDIIGGASPCQ